MVIAIALTFYCFGICLTIFSCYNAVMIGDLNLALFFLGASCIITGTAVIINEVFHNIGKKKRKRARSAKRKLEKELATKNNTELKDFQKQTMNATLNASKNK